jgi:hypothetical protein
MVLKRSTMYGIVAFIACQIFFNCGTFAKVPATKPAPIDSISKVLAKLVASSAAVATTNDSLIIDSIVPRPTVHRDAPGFGDRLVVYLKNTKKLIDSQKEVVLYIDHYPLKHVKGQRVDDHIYNFTLMNDQDTAFWTSLFLNAKHHKGQTRVDISIGTIDGAVVSNSINKPLEIYREGWMIFSWIAFVILSIVIMVAGGKSNILRETCDCQCSDTVKKKRRPFSLARTQMAFWTTIVAFAIIYIYFATGYMPEVSNTTLVLLGISASTTVFGYLIDNNVANSNTRTPGQEGDKCCSLGFFRDIVSDNGVPGIHRFQNIVFTLLLGIIYFYKVSHNLQMTEFSTNLLLLMGISSGAYVGVKFIVSTPSNTPTVASKPAESSQ